MELRVVASNVQEGQAGNFKGPRAHLKGAGGALQHQEECRPKAGGGVPFPKRNQISDAYAFISKLEAPLTKFVRSVGLACGQGHLPPMPTAA